MEEEETISQEKTMQILDDLLDLWLDEEEEWRRQAEGRQRRMDLSRMTDFGFLGQFRCVVDI